MRIPYILRTLAIFFSIFKNYFFPSFLKELEVHIVSMDDYKV